ncbi:hypothetical protein QJV38_14195 [Listeria cossartiae subsp. cayugensis]|uniref:Uncharacterized protein n=1 Tax=Listeria cossartiae subsp. cayugensis TaxID=2713505 RepID=A0ABU2IRN7_9LIST|nr:hypothetical protein [Listeria cossartiae]MDT0067285.1 hypothetical protein [Listeria cossartiae subsp. cayugensis]MDT0081201.1 hypothetical protein [Listeria cossartiae subsp. cayugensis]MDT0084037.1 hypothetical protein [Listeria cossartiae subsp. cayugensis]MDT0089495.1 hypothetical protein [Listeria cossartiae subsp. cayugensis]MDT0100634.1 hypothetical protein [Listeria cossartiae subsp. cayugensis]
MKKDKWLEYERISLNVIIVLAILVILIPMEDKDDSQLLIKVLAGALILGVTLARSMEKTELKIIMKRYRNLGKESLTSKKFNSGQTNEVSTIGSFIQPPLIRVTRVNVEIFEEALEKYMNSSWRTVNFTRKAQKAFDDLIQQIDEQRLAVSAFQQRMLENLDKRNADWEKNLHDESRLFDRESKLALRRRQESEIKHYFQKKNLIVTKIQEISMGYSLVYINSDQYIIRVVGDKVIDVYNWHSHENEMLSSPILIEGD